MTSSAPQPDDDLDARRLALTFGQVASLRWQIAAAALFIGVLIWPSVPHAVTIVWVTAMLLGRELRVRLLERLVRDERAPMRERLRRARWSILAVGIPQGSAALFMLWLEPAHDAILTMILVSLAAGAVSTSALIPGAFAIYSACLTVPPAIMWLAAGDAQGVGVAVLVLMFFGVQNRFARNNAATFEESFRIRRENDALVSQLAQARDAAEAASRAKTRFLAAASHDLRQPLHALSMQSAALTLEPQASDAPQIARAISQSIDGLSTLIDSLLDISKLDAGTMRVDPRPIQLSRLVRSVAQSYREPAEAKGLLFTLEAPASLVVKTDPVLLERILRNVIDNAVKYTASGSIDVSVAEDEGGACVCVRDTGCGIPAELHGRVFEEFYQVDRGKRDAAPGLGLGLSIVRRLVDLLGLSLQFESEPGRGTRISLRMPRPSPTDLHESAAGGTSPSPALDGLQGLCVLVVDDDKAVREATVAVLQRLGCRALSAGDCEEALEAAARMTPALVLTDYRLGDGETGIDLTHRLRRVCPGLRVLLISGDIAPDRLREAAGSGLTLLHKPLSAEQLREAIAATM
jgi:signal transduction histidine kinase